MQFSVFPHFSEKKRIVESSVPTCSELEGHAGGGPDVGGGPVPRAWAAVGQGGGQHMSACVARVVWGDRCGVQGAPDIRNTRTTV